jgi:hypothetical protein
MPTLVQLIAGAAGLAWVVVIIAAVKVIGATLARPTEAPPPGNSDWYLVMQGALWLAFLFMLAQSVLGWITHGGANALEAVATVSFAVGFAVTSVGFAITVVRWRRAKRASYAQVTSGLPGAGG